MVLLVFLPCRVGAEQSPRPAGVTVAQFGLPTGPSADWQQWDAFLTNVVKKVGGDLAEPRRDQLRELFLDSRYQLVETLSSGASDPVPRLFLDTWGRLGPILKQALPELPRQTANQYTTFISALDRAASVGNLTQGFGVLKITPDTLRGANALLGTGVADPLAYTVDVDAGLRSLLGFSSALPPPQVSPGVELGRLPSPERHRDSRLSAGIPSWFVPPAFADEEGFTRLNQWVPDSSQLSAYLLEVRRLLTQSSDDALAKSRLTAQYHSLYRQIVFAAAWQETCWRQYVRKGEKLTPIASATGDVGLMQVNRKTWRGLYDLNGLAGDITYNSRAGSEILLYYLSRFAIPKHEERQPGGQLARATYSAYNGGPGQLGRYRNAKTPAVWRKVDEAFWTKFRSVSAGQEMAVKECY